MASALADIISALPNCLVVARHGRTAWNDEDRLTTSTDVPLTAVGEDQALKLGEALAGVEFDFAAASPMQRARRTGELALALATSPELVLDDRLREPAAGPFEGLCFADLREGHALSGAYARYAVETGAEYPQGCEPVDETAGKAASFLADATARGGRQFVATHGAFARVLGCVFLGLDAGMYRRLKMSNCHVSVLQLHRKPPHQLIGWNLPPR